MTVGDKNSMYYSYTLPNVSYLLVLVKYFQVFLKIFLHHLDMLKGSQCWRSIDWDSQQSPKWKTANIQINPSWAEGKNSFQSILFF